LLVSRAHLPPGYDFASPSPDISGYWRIYMRKLGIAFFIRRVGGSWHAMMNDESLGSYASPAEAHKALVSGRTERPAPGVDPARLKLLPDLAQWPFYAGLDH
jgi:hypothetical protein